MIAQYHITFETPEFFGEADVEVTYAMEDDGLGSYAVIDKSSVQYEDITLTSKATGKSEFASHMPDDAENYAIEAADEQFTTEQK